MNHTNFRINRVLLPTSFVDEVPHKVTLRHTKYSNNLEDTSLTVIVTTGRNIDKTYIYKFMQERASCGFDFHDRRSREAARKKFKRANLALFLKLRLFLERGDE